MGTEFGSDLNAFELAEAYQDRMITGGELLDKICKFCWKHPDDTDSVLDGLSKHSNEAVRRVAAEVREMIRERREQVKDIDQIRKTSPLQPGISLVLYGGYAFGAKLNGREYCKATFIDFVFRGPDRTPAAFVELEEEIDLTEGSGLRHRGKYALLKLRFVANWEKEETVTVHIVDSMPPDVEEFYSSHPFGTEIESHASYRIAG